MVNRQSRARGEVSRPRERVTAVVRARPTPRAPRLGHTARPAPTKASRPCSALAHQGAGQRGARCVQMKHRQGACERERRKSGQKTMKGRNAFHTLNGVCLVTVAPCSTCSMYSKELKLSTFNFRCVSRESMLAPRASAERQIDGLTTCRGEA